MTTKKNSTYWRKRFELLEDAMNRDITKQMQEIDRIYKRAQADIEKQICAWYQRLAKNNEISMADARKLLSADELEEFKWSVEDYIKHGKENAIDQRWMKQLENASAKFHISKLEALKLQVQQSIEVVYGNQLDLLDEAMRQQYQEGYYHTAFEVQKGFSIGWPIAAIDQAKIDRVIRKPWAPDGKNFSERIWQNRTKLVNEVHNELSRMCITGEAPDRAIKNIAKKMNTSRYNAGRLIMTEAAYFGSISQKDCFDDLGVEQYEICATLDNRTSAICQEMDGKVFDMKDYEAGVTAPPFHVFCRSCTCPYFNDEFTVGEMRAARGADGKTYYVPADMKYPEWKKQFTGGGKPKTEKQKESATIQQLNQSGENVAKSGTNRGKNGIINIKIDEFVPCLKDAKSGEILDTEVFKITDRSALNKYNEKNGWNVDWFDIAKNNEVYALTLKGDAEFQGLVGLRPDKDAQAVYINWASTAPRNNKEINNGNQDYIGVGGHLFAIGAKRSMECGYEGVMYGFAANKKVMQHYIDKFGAVNMPIQHPYQIIIDEKAAQDLLNEYNYSWKE